MVVVSENAHNSWTAGYIWIKFCVLIYFNIIQLLVRGDEALPSIILAGQSILVKMLITLEPHHIFWSNFAYLYIFEISRENDKENKKNISHPWIWPRIVYIVLY